MWFKNAIRKLVKSIETRWAGSGLKTRAELDEKNNRLYLIPTLGKMIDPAKIVMWEARNIRRSPYLPALKKEEMLIPDGIITVFSSRVYLIPVRNQFPEATRLKNLILGIREFIKPPSDFKREYYADAFMNIINGKEIPSEFYNRPWGPEDPEELRQAYAFGAALTDGLRDAFRLIFSQMRKKEKEIGGHFKWDLHEGNMGTTENGQFILVDPIFWKGGLK